MISDRRDRQPNNIHLYTSFYSVAPHLELAILSRTFGITEHAQPSAVEHFNFFLQVHKDYIFTRLWVYCSKKQ